MGNPVPELSWCVIPAAGRGTRLASCAEGLPKALLEVGGKPIVHWLLGRLDGVVDRVCLVVPEEDDRIPERLGARHGAVRLAYVRQSVARGVGNAIAQAEESVSGPFLVTMGDVFYERSFDYFVRAWRQSGVSGAVLVEAQSAPEQRMGRVRVLDGRVVGIEKGLADDRFTHRLAGAAILPGHAFDVLKVLEPEAAGEIELESVVRGLIYGGHQFRAVGLRGWRANINTPEDLRAVTRRIERARSEGGGNALGPSALSVREGR